jgi:hypothetical protein
MNNRSDPGRAPTSRSERPESAPARIGGVGRTVRLPLAVPQEEVAADVGLGESLDLHAVAPGVPQLIALHHALRPVGEAVAPESDTGPRVADDRVADEHGRDAP